MKNQTIDKLNEIYDHYGREHQRRKLAEECAEFLEAVNEKKHEDDIKSEIADVFVVAAQLYFNDPEIMDMASQKIDRQLRRMTITLDTFIEAVRTDNKITGDELDVVTALSAYHVFIRYMETGSCFLNGSQSL